MANRFDEYIICDNHGKSISMKCQTGFIYNALTTACENGQSILKICFVCQ